MDHKGLQACRYKTTCHSSMQDRILLVRGREGVIIYCFVTVMVKSIYYLWLYCSNCISILNEINIKSIMVIEPTELAIQAYIEYRKTCQRGYLIQGSDLTCQQSSIYVQEFMQGLLSFIKYGNVAYLLFNLKTVNSRNIMLYNYHNY